MSRSVDSDSPSKFSSPLRLCASVRNVFCLAISAAWRLGERCLVFVLIASLVAAEPAAPEETLTQEFRLFDHDRSGNVSQEEFLAGIPDNLQKAGQHDFQLADFDRDGKLALSEFLALRGFSVPDPWTELTASALSTWQKVLKDADRNQDSQLSITEWPRQALSESLQPFDQLEFGVWDADQNGLVNLAEAQRMFEAAYGVRRLSGALLRYPNGDAVYWSYYGDLDRDRDGIVSEAEFVAVHWMGEARNKAYFAEIDANHDGWLSPKEFAQAEKLRTKSLDTFRQLDADFDGLVSEEELARQSPPVQNQRRRLKLGFPPFDDDRDGKYSFREFRQAPVGELYVLTDLLQRVDVDHDGGITWNEFHAADAPEFLGVAWEVFRRYDRNQDGRLTIDEYEFSIGGSPNAIADLFRVLDEDASGGLSVAEYLSLTPANQRKTAERDFKVMDFDRNDSLSPEEFAAAKGGPVPDPWLKLADQTQAGLWKLLAAADANGDQQLSREEWPAKELHSAFKPFGEIEFAKWDADQDGRVHQPDVLRMVHDAYGLIAPQGGAARWPDGSVLYWVHLMHLERDGNDCISEKKFVDRHWLETARNQTLFQELDADGDQQLSIKEITVKHSPLRIDLVAKFLEFDRNLDGRLDQAELSQQCPPAQGNQRGLKLGLAAFDRDGDGLDLDEFRLSPIGYLYVTVQLLNKKDTNQDGVISWPEFHPVPNPQFAGIAWEVFRRYDRDGDGELTTDEYDFPEDPQVNQLVQQVLPQVRETLQAELQFFLSICPLDAEQRQVLKPQLAGIQNLVARRLAGSQQQLIRGVNVNKLPLMPDPQRMISARLAQFAEQHLPADAVQAYREEMDARLAQQQRATIMTLVSRLDHVLLLSGEQRERISASLLEKWQPAWAQQIEMLLQNDQMLLYLPDEVLIPHLSPPQSEVWMKHPNKSLLTHYQRVRFFGDAGANAVPDDLTDLMPPMPQENVRQLGGKARNVRIKALEERKLKKAAR